MSIELVIFDFDGTLVDTAPDLVRATNLYLESQGLEALPEARIRSEIGMGMRRLILDVWPGDVPKDDNLRRKIEGEFMAVYEREYLHSPKLFEGAYEFLADWDRQIAIVSNKRVRYIHPILEKLELHTLPWTRVIGGDTYPNMKPHPEPFLGAIEAAGVTPEQTVIVGDGTPDVEGAVAIGSRCIACEHGYEDIERLMDLGAWARIQTFHDLLPLIRKIT
jgi:phosphoglycolate phosphatase